jgi:hypothetical protein
MAYTFYPTDGGAGNTVTEAQWTAYLQLARATGVEKGLLNEFATTVVGGNLQTNVASGVAWMQGHYVKSDATVTLTSAAADPSNPRNDLAVLEINWSTDAAVVKIVAGTPAGSPTDPALTQTSTVWQISLCRIRVAAGATALVSGNLTDLRQYAGAPNVAPAARHETTTLGVAAKFDDDSANTRVKLTPIAASVARGLALQWQNASNVAADGLVVRSDGKVDVTNAVNSVGGQATAGSFGVPVIVAQTLRQNVTNNAATTILSFSIPANGLYRLTFGLRVVTSGNPKPILKYSYTDPGGTNIGYRFATESGGDQVLDGSSTTVFVTSDLQLNPHSFQANVGTLDVVYQVASGTVNDLVSVVLERLG